MNLLFCSVGRRAELIKYFKCSLGAEDRIIATDNKATAPALYLADKHYLVPPINNSEYVKILCDICIKEDIRVITTFIDPEINILAQNRNLFESIGVEVLAPDEKTAYYCYDKFEMYKYLVTCGIPTPLTFANLESFIKQYEEKNISFPVFVKPRTGSGSVGALKINSFKQLQKCIMEDNTLIIQEFMDCIDLDADVYIDIISRKVVSVFSKRKLETKIGGANVTISMKDNNMFESIFNITSKFTFNGPIDMDFFYRDGKYYLSEINPRFGGAYLHAYGAGVDFIKLIMNNLRGIENECDVGNYKAGIVMMMYDSIVIKSIEEMSKLNIAGNDVKSIKQFLIDMDNR
jgi:carbamoyl-phosphate synthase large subunit